MKRLFRMMTVLLLMVFIVPIGFAGYKVGDFEIGGHLIARYNYWNWFDPKDPAGKDDSYDYEFFTAFLDLKYQHGPFEVFIQPEFAQMIDIPDNAFGDGEEGPLGIGAIYYAHNREDNPNGVGFHQAYFRYGHLGKPGLTVQLGRFDYQNGMESPAPNKKITLLKNMRIADRMISPIGWTTFWRSYNGARVDYDTGKMNFTLFYSIPTKGAFEQDFNEFADDIGVGSFVVTFKNGAMLKHSEAQVFYYFYHDERECPTRVDNSGQSVSEADIDIHSLGGHYITALDLGPGQMDVLFWGVMQIGDWYELDHQAFAGQLDVGYQFTHVFGKPWIRMGYYYSTGDDDPDDGDHETFFQMLPGTRKYQLLPFYDLMNNQDAYIQVLMKPVNTVSLRMDYHLIRLTESNDLWYMGSGPTENEGPIFGYLGKSSHGETELGQELDFVVNWTPVKWVKLTTSYSHVFGGDVVDAIYDDSDADYLMIQGIFRF